MTEHAYPLSSLQLRQLKLPSNIPTSTNSRLWGVYSWPATTDESTIVTALKQVVIRHESLRTNLVNVADIDQPLQKISENVDVSVSVEDADLESVYKKMANSRQEKFVSTLNITLWLVPGQPLLSVEADPVFVDRPSLDLIVAEAIALIEKDAQLLEEEPVQYIDYIEWQEELMEEQASAIVESQAQSLDANQTLSVTNTSLSIESLPSDRSKIVMDSGVTSANPKLFVVDNVDAELQKLLQSVVSRYSVSCEALLFSNWQILLSQLTDGQPASIGWYSSGRNEELNSAIGVFECHLPTESDTNEALTIDLIMSNEKKRQQQLHQQFLIDWSSQPLLPWLFEWQSTPSSPIQQATFFPDGARLKLSIVEKNDQLAVSIAYDSRIFCEDGVAYLAERFYQILNVWIRNVDVAVDQLKKTRSQLGSLQFGEKFNADHQSILHQFDKSVLKTPHAPAVHFRNNTLTYGELDRRSNQLANLLLKNGKANGAAIGIYAQRSSEMIIAILGVLKAGAAYIALDPNYPEDRLSHIISDADATQVIVCERESPAFLQTSARTIHLHEMQDQLALSSSAAPTVTIHPQQRAYILYTSGSTGLPKGVSVSHRNLLASTQARMSFYPQCPASFLLLSSFAFDSSIAGIFWTLCSGGALCLPEPSEELNVLGLSALMRQYNVSHLLCLPALYSAMLEQGSAKEITTLTNVIVAGEACPLGLVEKHHESTSSVLLTNEYGPTEATVWCSAFSFDHERAENLQYVPIGHAINGTNLYVLDHHQQPVAKGVSGELYIGGQGITQGYLHQPMLSAERYLPDPFVDGPGCRMYRSGDRVRLGLDGELEFLGRTDHQVKIRGFRIELTEIERQLMNHPQVINCAVIVITASEGNKQLAAVIEAGELSEQEALNHLEQRVPQYMLPTRWLMIDKLPTNANGKVDRNQLSTLFDKYLGAGGTSRTAVYEAPETVAEKALCDICSELMNIEQVGISDNFFQLGGDSILSLQVVARAAKQGLALTPQELFENPVIADAAAITRACDPVLDDSVDQPPNDSQAEPHIDVDISDSELDDLLAEIE